MNYLSHMHAHLSLELEINSAVTQYSTTKVVPNRKDLGFQDQTTENKMLQQLHLTVKTPYIQQDGNQNALLAFQFYTCLLFSNVCNAFDSKQDAATNKKKSEESKEVMK